MCGPSGGRSGRREGEGGAEGEGEGRASWEMRIDKHYHVKWLEGRCSIVEGAQLGDDLQG